MQRFLSRIPESQLPDMRRFPSIKSALHIYDPYILLQNPKYCVYMHTYD